MSGPTPGASYGQPPTPGLPLSAPTPGPIGAPTPGRAVYERATPAATPGASYSSIATPGAGYGATPGAGYGATPSLYGTTPGAFGAPTPAATTAPAHNSSQASALPADWAEAGLLVSVISNGDFEFGRYDDMTGYITSLRTSGGETLCSLRISDERVDVPIQYLDPVRPTRPQQACVVVGSGPYRRMHVVTSMRDSDEWLVTFVNGATDTVESKHLSMFDASLAA